MDFTTPTTQHKQSSDLKLLAGIGFLVIMHAVGLWGMLWSEEPQRFARLTPVNLLVCTVVLAAFHRPWSSRLSWFAGIVALLGFLVEVLGVQTGWPFGEYSYGRALGPQLAEVPLLIGLNWLLLTYCSGVIVTGWVANKWLRILGAALLMVGMDILIEPVAIRFDFWSWHQNVVPVGNYLGWFGVALLQQVIFQKLVPDSVNRLSGPLLLIQAAFFIALQVFI